MICDNINILLSERSTYLVHKVHKVHKVHIWYIKYIFGT